LQTALIVSPPLNENQRHFSFLVEKFGHYRILMLQLVSLISIFFIQISIIHGIISMHKYFGCRAYQALLQYLACDVTTSSCVCSHIHLL
jgi:hypothetical protein